MATQEIKTKIIDPFTNIPLIGVASATDNNAGGTFLSALRELSVGDGGAKVFRADQQGIWLGADTYDLAPFKVSMAGIMYAIGASISGFIQVGGAASDINGNTTTINGGKITTGSITALQIAANTITASQLSFVPVDSTNVVASINASSEGITISGNRLTINSQTIFASGYNPTTKLPTASAGDLAYLDMVEKAKLGTTIISGGYIITSLLTADNIQTGTLSANRIASGSITAAKLSVTNLASISADLGLITAGQITFQQTTNSGAKLRWADGSRIWTDNNGYQGFNALGGRQYFYTSSDETMVLVNGNQAWFNYGISCRGDFNVTTGNIARFASDVYFGSGNENMWGGSGHLDANATTYFYVNINGNQELRVSATGVTAQGYFYNAGTNYMEFKDYRLTLTGDKTAILPTSRGFNALYCMESPEVWFMDFCKKKNVLDPLFREVTVSPYYYIKCVGGAYQVWGKRKGHEHKRFESKTKKEFLANEKFLSMNKVR